MSDKDIHAAGMKVRRKILGEAHVDRAVANTTPLNREFQDLLTRYGWGEIWTRPGFDYRTRRILVLGTMMAIGRWEEFSMHLRAALIDGMSLDDIKEILLQQAIYCGLPVTNTAYHHLDAVIAELTEKGVKINRGSN
ncbi:MAG TPA: carboxymuconolactone decarboxylase family protein [Kiloniellaceae bacterium]